ncbi:MAG: hypothetical protein R3B93_08650 [Bacteroidia bacterium]
MPETGRSGNGRPRPGKSPQTGQTGSGLAAMTIDIVDEAMTSSTMSRICRKSSIRKIMATVGECRFLFLKQ